MEDSAAVGRKDKDFGKSKYGCEHYRRRCRIRVPCCNKVFTCRHCHNEATCQSSLSDLKDHHKLVRHDVSQVICAVCDTEQEVAQVCSNCGVNMGEYFCSICKFYDDDVRQEYCISCYRVGGRENFFHCPKCGSCYTISLRDNHCCIENSMKNHCPVCYEGTYILNCGHTIHMDCLNEMATQNQYRCPICSKTALNMSNAWSIIDEQIAATPMPKESQCEVSILCNDCNTTGKAPFHIYGLKCSQCRSYNTRRISAREHSDGGTFSSRQEHQD